MADPKHIELLRYGPAALREWRTESPNQTLDLSGADLQGALLVRFDLSSADLRGADLGAAIAMEVDFSNADLRFAKLVGADLRNANLSAARLDFANAMKANLAGAILRHTSLCRSELAGVRFVGADLSEAHLSGAHFAESDLWAALLLKADLRGTYFARCRLVGPNFEGAIMGNTVIVGCDLSGVAGLETVDHEHPSHIGVDTIHYTLRGSRADSQLARFFLRAGVPPPVLKALRAGIRDIRYYDCFICYGEPDKSFAVQLHERLSSHSIESWMYEMSATPGRRTWQEVGEARRAAARFIVLCSASAFVRDGVLKELEEQIDDRPDRIVPVSVDSLWREPGFRVMRGTRDLKPFLLERNYIDGTVVESIWFARLLAALQCENN